MGPTASPTPPVPHWQQCQLQICGGSLSLILSGTPQSGSGQAELQVSRFRYFHHDRSPCLLASHRNLMAPRSGFRASRIGRNCNPHFLQYPTRLALVFCAVPAHTVLESAGLSPASLHQRANLILADVAGYQTSRVVLCTEIPVSCCLVHPGVCLVQDPVCYW